MSRRVKRPLSAAARMFAVSLAVSSFVRADVDAAKKYVATAKEQAEQKSFRDAGNNLDLAEAELDGADADTKKAVTDQIAAIRKQMSDGQSSELRGQLTTRIDRQLERAKEGLGIRDVDGDLKEIEEWMAADGAKVALGEEQIGKYAKQISTLRKVNKNKMSGFAFERAKSEFESAEKEWPEKKTAIATNQQSAESDVEHTIDRLTRLLRDLPDDDAQTKDYAVRLKKLQTEFNAEVFKGKAAETFSRLSGSWESYGDEYNGWEAETTGATFDQMMHEQGDKMSKFLAPKSVGLVSRANDFLKNALDDEATQVLAVSDPKVKGLIDGIRNNRAAAWEKLAKFAGAVIDAAEKTELTEDGRDRLEQLAQDDIRLALEGSQQQKALQARAMKLVNAFDTKAGGDAAAKEKLYNTLVEQATKHWPEMEAKVSSDGEFDPNAVMKDPASFKGKTFKFKGVNNRMGWDYRPGAGFEFALTQDAIPVAGKYESDVNEAFTTLYKKTGRDFSDETYDVIATVTDVGPVIRIARAEGTLQTEGGEKLADIKAQRDETVPAIRLKIIGLHVGPLAVISGQGSVGEDGSVK